MKPATPVLTQAGTMVNWQPVPGATEYKVEFREKNSTLLACPSRTTQLVAYNIMGLLNWMLRNKKILEIYVSAINAAGEESNVAQLELTPLPAPTPPSPLVLATPAGFVQTGVTLTWVAVPNAVSYTVNGQLVAGGRTLDSVPDAKVTSPIYDGQALLQKLAANPGSQALVSICANGPGGEVSQAGQFQMTAPVATGGQKKNIWQSFTAWLTGQPANNAGFLDRPVVKWGIVVMAALLIIGIPIAYFKKKSNNDVAAAVVTAPAATSQILRLVDVAQSLVPQDWTKEEPDDVWDLATESDGGKKQVVIPSEKDIVLITPKKTDMKVDVVDGLEFEYAYNTGSLSRPVWATQDSLAKMVSKRVKIENKAYRFKTGKTPLILKFELNPQS